MFIDIQSFFFHPFIYPDTNQSVGYLKQQISHNRTEYNGNQGSYKLYTQLMPITVKSSLHSSFTSDELSGKDTRQDRTNDTAYSMYTESIEGKQPPCKNKQSGLSVR